MQQHQLLEHKRFGCRFGQRQVNNWIIQREASNDRLVRHRFSLRFSAVSTQSGRLLCRYADGKMQYTFYSIFSRSKCSTHMPWLQSMTGNSLKERNSSNDEHERCDRDHTRHWKRRIVFTTKAWTVSRLRRFYLSVIQIKLTSSLLCTLTCNT